MKDDFLWGVATSSFQIEGANDVDGKLESVWDRFCSTPDKIKNREHAKLACDHYNRYHNDFELLTELGVKCYRFSVSWPRVVQSDLKTKNQNGIDFYKGIIDDLLDRDIIPFLTLNHWDVPQIFHEKGGWKNRECMKYFLDYCDLVSREFGDTVKHWITHNEPWVISNLGYKEGTHAPGEMNLYKSLEVNHHLLMSHGFSVPIIKQNSSDSDVGIVLNLTPGMSASSSNADKDATLLFNQLLRINSI